MTIALYAQLAALALIDSTSIGTLLIPLWLLMRPDTRRVLPRIMLYLGVLAVFYLLVGVGILSGAAWVSGGLGVGSLMQNPAVPWAMAIGGGALLIYSFVPTPVTTRPKAALSAGAAGRDGGGPGTPTPIPDRDVAPPAIEVKWQRRLSKALQGRGTMVGLAVIAGLLELPTMVPYLVAIGVLSNASVPIPAAVGLLIAYCLVMLVPALVLVSLRAAAGARLDPLLRRTGERVGKFVGESMPWVLGILGFLLLRGGLSAIAPAASWNPFK